LSRKLDLGPECRLQKTRDQYFPSRALFLKNQDHEVSKAVAKAILELGSINDWVTIWFHHSDVHIWKDPFLSAIINSGEKAVPELTKLLQDPDPKIQRDAADIIAKTKRGEKNEFSGYHGETV
jgi:HEAT repeat protein